MPAVMQLLQELDEEGRDAPGTVAPGNGIRQYTRNFAANGVTESLEQSR
jgi:hypothetical protein